MIRRVLRTWAEDAAAFAVELARVDPSWGSETFELAGGRVVLCGPGMYVNRALAVGLDGQLSTKELDQLERRSAAAGVPAAVEVTLATDPSVQSGLTDRGYQPGSETTAMRRSLDGIEREPDDSIVIRPANTELLAIWQATSALGWGHEDPASRRASDVFSRVAATVDG